MSGEKHLYAAYGSNMDTTQMADRCPDATVMGKAYLEGWELTMPFYANIEKAMGKRTPVLIWQITANDEKRLDRCEGYPKSYTKVDVEINLNGKIVSAMVYVMTDVHKNSGKTANDGYEEKIKQGYLKAGFSLEEFQPTRNKAV